TERPFSWDSALPATISTRTAATHWAPILTDFSAGLRGAKNLSDAVFERAEKFRFDMGCCHSRQVADLSRWAGPRYQDGGFSGAEQRNRARGRDRLSVNSHSETGKVKGASAGPLTLLVIGAEAPGWIRERRTKCGWDPPQM